MNKTEHEQKQHNSKKVLFEIDLQITVATQTFLKIEMHLLYLL